MDLCSSKISRKTRDYVRFVVEAVQFVIITNQRCIVTLNLRVYALKSARLCYTCYLFIFSRIDVCHWNVIVNVFRTFYWRYSLLIHGDKLDTECDTDRPVDSHSRARETILAGPYHNLIPTETSRHLSSVGEQGRVLERGGCIMHGRLTDTCIVTYTSSVTNLSILLSLLF